jgi:dTDP-glucose pyrophosphorylase
MKNIYEICIKSNATIEESLRVIDRGASKIALIVDDRRRLIGTLSDGDIRRGLLKKKKLRDFILDIYFQDPIKCNHNTTKQELLSLCHKHKIDQIPIVDEKGVVVDLYILNDLVFPKNYNNKVVLMVGGLGKRLRPLTENTPKPMLHVGGKPILQTIVKGFVDSGFTNITMCLGYKANVIQDYFKDGSSFGANIDYIVEEKRMGTAGALTLLSKRLNKPFFVMNGDLLTDVNYEQMLDFHESHNSKATVCVREYDFQVPYGVVNINNEDITSIEEKPVHSFFVNAGIYLLKPECIDLIPNDEFYDMTSLIEKIIFNKDRIVSFPIREYWLDIGRMDEFKQANRDVGALK